MADNLPPIPEGFSMEESAPASELPPMPEGFSAQEPSPPAEQEPVSWGDWLKTQGVAAARGARESLPFAKDISAATRAYVGNPLTGAAPSGEFEQEKRAVEAQQERAAEEAPVAKTAGEIGGYFLPGVGLAGRAAKAEQALAAKAAPYLGKTGANIASGALTGAGLGAVQGLGTGTDLEERLGSAATTGALGGVGGAAFPAVGAAVGAGAKKLLNVGSALTPAEEAAARQGVKLPRFLGAEGEGVARAAEHLGALPVIGAPIRKAGAKALEQTEEAFGKIPGVKPDIGREEAGETAKEALHNWVSDRSKRVADKAYDVVEQHVNPSIKTELTNTRQTVQGLMDKLKEANLPEESEAVKMVLDAASNPDGLSFSGIKTLRTKVREKIQQGILSGNLSQGELKQLKSALNKDLEAAAGNAGGQRGIAAYKRADKLYQGIQTKRKELAKIIGKSADASPTAVYNRITQMATDKTGNPARLLTARKSMSPDQWGEVTSGVVNNMGRDVEGNFSPYRFMTEYGKMSEKGRDAIFGPVGNPVRDAIEDIGLISKQFKTAGKHKNWSGTAHTALGAAGILEAFHDPAAAATGAAPVLPLALLLASPKSAKQLSGYLRAPTKKTYEALMNSARIEAGKVPAATRPIAAADDEREAHAAGGKVGKRDYPAKRLTRMERAVKRAQEAIALETKPLMDRPDEQIARALEIAKDK
jgi:hypothetical protein